MPKDCEYMKLDILERSLSFIWPKWGIKHVIVVIDLRSKAGGPFHLNTMRNSLVFTGELRHSVFVFLNWCKLLSTCRCWHFKIQVKFLWWNWSNVGASLLLIFFWALDPFIKWDLLRVHSRRMRLVFCLMWSWRNWSYLCWTFCLCHTS